MIRGADGLQQVESLGPCGRGDKCSPAYGKRLYQARPYAPPDLFYYFASYKVGKNPTTVTPVDVNQDGFTDLVTTNIGSNTLSILLGNGDGTFRDQIQLNVCKEPRSARLRDVQPRSCIPMWSWPARGGDEVAVLFRPGRREI